MKKLCLSIFLFAGLIPAIGFAQTRAATPYYQTATILSVQKHKVSSPEYMGGDTPSDAPLQSRYYIFDISVRTNCGIYRGKFDTPFNYFPSAFTPNHPLWVHVSKHEMRFALPDNQQIKLRIVRRNVDRAESCVIHRDSRS